VVPRHVARGASRCHVGLVPLEPCRFAGRGALGRRAAVGGLPVAKGEGDPDADPAWCCPRADSRPR
jgi:hypothetical protein